MGDKKTESSVEKLLNCIENKHISFTLHPAHGCIGRRGPGVSDPLPPYIYVKPKEVTLKFVVQVDNPIIYSQLKSSIEDMCKNVVVGPINLRSEKQIKDEYKQKYIDIANLGKQPPLEWFEEIHSPTYLGCWLEVKCDYESLIYKTLDDKGIIDSHVPDWYKRGDY